VSGGKSKAQGTRLFVALDPPAEVREQVSRWAREIAGRDHRMRPVPARNSHITLAFIGETPESQVWTAAEAIESVAGTVDGLSLGAPVWLPARRPRVLALGVHDENGELARCQRRVAEALHEAIGWRSDRSFFAHLTAIRLGRGFQPREIVLPVSPAISFSAESVTLYASRLLPEGVEYEAIATVVAGDA
jgi:2'-5' RNA ligase